MQRDNGSFVFYAWDRKLGFKYVKVTRVNDTYVKHIITFIKITIFMSKWVHPLVLDAFGIFRNFSAISRNLWRFKIWNYVYWYLIKLIIKDEGFGS